jgi:hypothetical protein
MQPRVRQTYIFIMAFASHEIPFHDDRGHRHPGLKFFHASRFVWWLHVSQNVLFGGHCLILSIGIVLKFSTVILYREYVVLSSLLLFTSN